LDPTSSVHDFPLDRSGLGSLFVAVAVEADGADARVRLASAVARDWLVTTEVDEVRIDDAGTVRGRRLTRYLDLELDARPVPVSDAAAAEVLARVAADRLDEALPTSQGFQVVRARLAAAGFEVPWAELVAGLCHRRRSLAELREADWIGAARDHLGHRRWVELDAIAPERLSLPSGRTAAIDWSADGPVVAVRIQDLFGLRETPTVGRGRTRVRLHLLAPNGRPQQITDDLAGFWARTWPEVRKELRGRYPKHAWPEDPLTAPPRRGPGR
ncbi:MAG: ATP-dependent helicase C-terminal domain-containing protein, partial [Myxococcota bacterium]